MVFLHFLQQFSFVFVDKCFTRASALISYDLFQILAPHHLLSF